MTAKGWIAAAAMIAMVPPFHAEAATYVGDRGKWLALSEVAKLGYAAGAFDAMQVLRDGDLVGNAHTRGRSKCGTTLALEPSALVKLISDEYERNPAAWALPASAVLNNELNKVCASYINAERQALGLPLIKP